MFRGINKEVKDINFIIEWLKVKVNDIFVKYRFKNFILNKEVFMREYNNFLDFKFFYDFVVFYMKIYSRRLEIGIF